MLLMYPTPPAGLSYIWKCLIKLADWVYYCPKCNGAGCTNFSSSSPSSQEFPYIEAHLDRLFTGYFYRIRKNTLKLIYHIWIWTELLDPTTLCCAPSYWSSILPKYLNGPSNVGQHPLWNFHSTSLLFDMISTVKEGIEKTFTQPEQGVIKSNENYCLRRYLLWIWLEFLNDTET